MFLRVVCFSLLGLLGACAWRQDAMPEISTVDNTSDESVTVSSPSRWNCVQDSADSWSCESPLKISEPEPLGTTPLDGAWVLQIAAFQQVAHARQAITDMAMAGLVIIPTQQNGENWYVLIADAFANYPEAKAAGEAYLRAFPKGSIYLRPAADLIKVAVNK